MIARLPIIGPVFRGSKFRLEAQAARIQDPVERLRYLRSKAAPAEPRSSHGRRTHRIARHVASAVVLIAILAIAVGHLPTSLAGTSTRERHLLWLPVAAASPGSPAAPGSDPGSSVAAPVTGALSSEPPSVWRVENSGAVELYSNGLRIDTTFAVSNRPRARYPVYSLARAAGPAKFGDAPVGLVFHTTESHLAPFEEDQNRRLREFGRNLIELLRRERSYHYLIDRFGRVFRIVNESDAANHAGNSVWADPEGIYVNLNDSFLGVAFEAQTSATDAVTAAQIASAKALTEMLRGRYHIPAENCVTHAQVSVNPDNMHIGAHTDWAGDFLFAALGLPDNYAVALPSIYAFGFEFDSVFLQATRSHWKGLDLAEDQIRREAQREGMPPDRYRTTLRHRYWDIIATLAELRNDIPAPANTSQ